jgi:catechol 2,3-dioxygenase-like lactoylglutathione lyase family enzyme
MKSSPFGFQSVKVIALAATDVARAQRFYSESLQLEEDRDSTEEMPNRYVIGSNPIAGFRRK